MVAARLTTMWWMERVDMLLFSVINHLVFYFDRRVCRRCEIGQFDSIAGGGATVSVPSDRRSRP